MSKIGSNNDNASKVSVRDSSLAVNNGIKCLSFIMCYVVIIAVAANQFGDATSLLAQNDTAGDRTLGDNNIRLSSSMSQTSSPGESGQENISKSSTENQTSSPRLPILTEISDKGTYKVELRWSSPLNIQSPAILSNDGFDMELLFLNASAQETTPETVQGDSSNLTMDFERSITSEVANLSSLEPIVPVESFDMTIYDDKGNELWNKMDQTLTAGRALMRVMLDPNYSGGITMTISDIKSPITSGSNEKADESVRFTATVKGGQS